MLCPLEETKYAAMRTHVYLLGTEDFTPEPEHSPSIKERYVLVLARTVPLSCRATEDLLSVRFFLFVNYEAHK
jgi:hypothetical protein